MAEVLYKAWPELSTVHDTSLIMYAGPVKPHTMFSFTDSEIAEYVDSQTDKQRVLWFNISEPVLSASLQKIHNVIKLLKTNKPHYYTTASINGDEVYTQWCIDNNETPLVSILCADEFTFAIRDLLQTTPNEYIPKIRKKKYINLNKMERKHRVVLIAHLIKEQLIDQGYNSFYSSDFTNNWVNTLVEQFDHHSVELKTNNWYGTPKWVADVLRDNIDLFPMHISGDKESRQNPIDIIDEDKQYFDESYFSVVTETMFFGDASCHLSKMMIPSVMFSEKIYKAVLLKHPFILAGVVGSLKWFKKLGYKTFHPYINESYDDEPDDYKRLEMITSEIKRLCNQTDEEWLEWQKNVKEIVDYNYIKNSSIQDIAITRPNI